MCSGCSLSSLVRRLPRAAGYVRAAPHTAAPAASTALAYQRSPYPPPDLGTPHPLRILRVHSWDAQFRFAWCDCRGSHLRRLRSLSSDLTEQESDLAHLKAGMVAFLVLWINITQDGPKTRICDSVRKSDGPACLYFLCMEASKEDQKLFTKTDGAQDHCRVRPPELPSHERTTGSRC